jgi:DNA-binding CsgD family transcriptional regulator/PAS domain-containing protein
MLSEKNLDSVRGVIIFDSNLIITFANDEAYKLLASPKTRLNNNSLANIFKFYGGLFPYDRQNISYIDSFEKFTIFLPKYPGKKIELECKLESLSRVDDLSKSFMLIFEVSTQLHDPTFLFPQAVHTVVSKIAKIEHSADIELLLGQIIKTLPGKAHFKSAKNFQYKYINQATQKLFGVKVPEELIGLTDYDIEKHIMKWRWPTKFSDELREMDLSVVTSNVPIIALKEKPYINADGRVVTHSLTKIPLTGIHGNPLGVLTFAMDIEQLRNLHELRKLYTNLYENRKLGHIKYLEHIGIQKYMSEKHKDNEFDLPTEREIDALILSSQGKTAKEAAKILNISYRTFEKFIDVLKIKLGVQSKNDLVEIYFNLVKYMSL